MKFFSIASCSDGNSYALFDDPSDIILIDAGISFRKLKHSFENLGLNIYNIKHIVITHSHNDHTKGLLSIYTHISPKIHVNGANSYHFKRYDSMLEFYMYMEPIVIGEFNILPVNVSHDALNSALLVTYKDKRFGFISDAGYLTDEHITCFKEIDMLAIESNHSEEHLENTKYPAYLKHRISSKYGHLSNNQTFDAVMNLGSPRLKQVLFIHLSKRSNSPEILQKECIEKLQIALPHINYEIAPYDDPSKFFEI